MVNWGTPIEWFKAAVPLLVALIAARAGLRYGLMKTRLERGFDRRLAWCEQLFDAVKDLDQSIDDAAAAEWLRPVEWNSQTSEGLRQRITERWALVQQRRESVWRLLGRFTLYGTGQVAVAALNYIDVISKYDHLLNPWDKISFDAQPLDSHPLRTDTGEKSPEYLELDRAITQLLEAIKRAVHDELIHPDPSLTEWFRWRLASRRSARSDRQ